MGLNDFRIILKLPGSQIIDNFPPGVHKIVPVSDLERHLVILFDNQKGDTRLDAKF